MIEKSDFGRLLERVKGRKVFIGVPIYDTPERLHSLAMEDLLLHLEKAGIKAYLGRNNGCSDLAYARNMMAAEFLKGDCDDLVWIDSDINFDPRAFLALIMSEDDFIAGPYKKKVIVDDADEKGWAFRKLQEGKGINEAGRYEVQGVGLGFTKTSRRVFEAIIAEFPWIKKKDEVEKATTIEPDEMWGFFQFNGLGQSEDYLFGDRWRATGGKIFINPVISLGHIGKYEFRGDVERVL